MPSLISFLHNNAARFGRLDGETVTDLTASFDGRFASLSDAANAGALAELYAADGASTPNTRTARARRPTRRCLSGFRAVSSAMAMICDVRLNPNSWIMKVKSPS